ncbi:Pimeloyl-ACP methyl ester carboxylesterase [Glycomyces sambucus]|uniref:Pimeloyl-ACP methyl ester carboxylesterase n=1 Tax=Glycomyces sambucus TaxID=380244 RepID=A0A1G9FYH3_9ACTN|nr:alpha/beta hydrolase [Glycomyces sambucus]SDK93450.1 Pimeloyl-ACP methyl ester carboxylesterase [Glycomyces sambucus]
MSINFGVTQFLEIDGERLAYDVAGEGPLVVLFPGMGQNRHSYRAVAERLVADGFRVARADLRGHGESSDGWASYTRSDVADDLIALVRALGGPAVVAGHSVSGGAATIAAVLEPELFAGIVELSPFTRDQKFDLKAVFANGRYRKGMSLLMGTAAFRSLKLWNKYLDHAIPGTRPADWDEYRASVNADLSRPGRMAIVSRIGMSPTADADAKLAALRVPTVVVEGDLDPDWPDPAAEGAGIVAGMPEGVGRVEVIEGAGHYPHVQFPERVAGLIAALARETARG